MPKAKLTTRERTTSNVSTDNLNKGSELSFAEADSNFINLRDRSWGLADDTSTVLQVTDDKTITIAGGANVTTALSGDTLTITANAVSSGGDIGDLQVVGTEISPVTTNADLTLSTNGTGEVIIEKLNFTEGTATINSQASNAATIQYTPTTGQERDRITLFAGNVSNNASSSKGSEIALQIKSGVGSTSNGIFLRDLNPFVGSADINDFVFLGTAGEAVETPHLWIGTAGKVGTQSRIKIESSSVVNSEQQSGDITVENGRSESVYTNGFSKIVLSSLPTSDPTNAGQLWNDSGTLKVSAG